MIRVMLIPGKHADHKSLLTSFCFNQKRVCGLFRWVAIGFAEDRGIGEFGIAVENLIVRGGMLKNLEKSGVDFGCHGVCYALN